MAGYQIDHDETIENAMTMLEASVLKDGYSLSFTTSLILEHILKHHLATISPDLSDISVNQNSQPTIKAQIHFYRQIQSHSQK